MSGILPSTQPVNLRGLARLTERQFGHPLEGIQEALGDDFSFPELTLGDLTVALELTLARACPNADFRRLDGFEPRALPVFLCDRATALAEKFSQPGRVDIALDYLLQSLYALLKNRQASVHAFGCYLVSTLCRELLSALQGDHSPAGVERYLRNRPEVVSLAQRLSAQPSCYLPEGEKQARAFVGSPDDQPPLDDSELVRYKHLLDTKAREGGCWAVTDEEAIGVVITQIREAMVRESEFGQAVADHLRPLLERYKLPAGAAITVNCIAVPNFEGISEIRVTAGSWPGASGTMFVTITSGDVSMFQQLLRQLA